MVTHRVQIEYRSPHYGIISHQSDRRIKVSISRQSNHRFGTCLHQSERQDTVPHVNHVMKLVFRKVLRWNQPSITVH